MGTVEMKGLKKCPFCGGVAKIRIFSKGIENNTFYEKFKLECEGCGITKISKGSIGFDEETGEAVTLENGKKELVDWWNNAKR